MTSNDEKARDFITGSLSAGNEANLVALAAIRGLVGRTIVGFGMCANGAFMLMLDNDERVLFVGESDEQPGVAIFPDCLLHEGIDPQYRAPEIVIKPEHFGNQEQKEEQPWQ